MPSIDPSTVLPDVIPPIRKRFGERFFPRIMFRVPIDRYSVGVQRQLAAASDLTKIESAAVLVQPLLVEPSSNAIVGCRTADSLLRGVPDVVENGDE